MYTIRFVHAWMPIILSMSVVATTTIAAPDKQTLDRGRYLVSISACNDCHTAGYREAGNVPVDQWLTGSPVGFQGPWGTTYPANLRLVVQAMNETEWVSHARAVRRPPMPWFNLRDMSEPDLRAIYQFIRSLGPKGEAAPAFAPPGQAVKTPYVDFVVKNVRP